MITTGAIARLPAEEVIDFDKKWLRCPACRGALQRQEITARNGWRRIEVYCTGLECTFRQIVGISVTGELRTFEGEEDVPPPAKRKLKPGERRPGAITCAAAGCDKPITAKRLCQTHYYRWGELGKPGGDERVGWLEAGGPPVRDWKALQVARRETEASEAPVPPAPPAPPVPEQRPAKATRPPQSRHGPPAKSAAGPSGEPRRPPQAPTTPATAAPVPPPRTAMRPASGGDAWRGKFIAFREATELLRLELPRGTSEIVLVRTGQFLTVGRLDGLVLGQVPIAEVQDDG